MAEFIEAVLPSGRAVRLERMTTARYREAMNYAAGGAVANEMQYALKLNHAMLLYSLRAYTHVLEWVHFPAKDAQGNAVTDTATGKPAIGIEIDVDKMLDSVPAEAWIKVTQESLSIVGTSLDDILSDPADYQAATAELQRSMSGAPGRSAALRGKVRISSTS